MWLVPILVLLSSMATSSAPILEKVEFSSLWSWTDDNHAAAMAAFQRSCREILDRGSAFSRSVRFGGRREDWAEVCAAAYVASNPREFFESHFTAYRVIDPDRPEGLFTGYFEPEVEGSQVPDGIFRVPLYRKPEDLVSFDTIEQSQTGLAYGRRVNGGPLPYFTREEIETGALAGRELEIVWLKDWADAFFIQVQGSGRVHLPDGSTLRLSYAAKSGQPYTGIGAVLVQRGAFAHEDMSMKAIRDWIRKNPGESRSLMWLNKSFIFFREAYLADSSLGPLGAQHVQLTPLRSLAVDRSIWMFGTPIWLETTFTENHDTASQFFRRLLIAQDTGSAIAGPTRGDVFWGFGEVASGPAGHMKSSGTMIVLLPTQVARHLDLLR